MKRLIIKKVSENLKIDEDVVHKVYMSYWKYIKEKMCNPTGDEILNNDNNINIFHVGRLVVNNRRYKKLKEIYNDKHKED